MALCPPNEWCGHCTGLFAHRTGGAITPHGCLPTKRVVRPPSRVFTHQMGGAVTTPGCSPTQQVVWTSNWLCMGLFANLTGGGADIERDCLQGYSRNSGTSGNILRKNNPQGDSADREKKRNVHVTDLRQSLPQLQSMLSEYHIVPLPTQQHKLCFPIHGL